MGEKSLLSLLEEEDRLIRDIERIKDSSVEFCRYMGEYGVNPSSAAGVALKCAKKGEKLADSLVSTRKEMQKYIKFIMEV